MSIIELHTRFAPDWNQRAVDSDFSAASEEDLRYREFLGDVEFTIGDADFSAPWGWIPLLDFVMGLLSLLRELPNARSQVFEFTEAGSEIRFHLMEDGAVEVRCNYAPAIAHTSYSELLDAMTLLAEDVLTALSAVAPSLGRNEVFRRYAQEVGIR